MGAIINRPVRILICSAILEEQELLSGLSTPGIQIVPIVCGVGNVSAAIALTEYLQRNDAPDEILFVGSAGTYSAGLDQFKSGVSNVFFQRELAVERGDSQRPSLMPAFAETRQGSIAAGLAKYLHALTGSTNCPDSITLINPAGLFQEIAFENMECFGLGLVANKMNVPFTAFFALTNSVGPAGSESWRRNYKNYSEQLQMGIVRYVTSLHKSI
ncbi:MAG: hypothetical protein K8S54_05555 [Spirochaetia bacterium]|nr:hypothetical protein [Spirochaetia bacterium]